MSAGAAVSLLLSCSCALCRPEQRRGQSGNPGGSGKRQTPPCTPGRLPLSSVRTGSSRAPSSRSAQQGRQQRVSCYGALLVHSKACRLACIGADFGRCRLGAEQAACCR